MRGLLLGKGKGECERRMYIYVKSYCWRKLYDGLCFSGAKGFLVVVLDEDGGAFSLKERF